jgi:hypothetical protein
MLLSLGSESHEGMGGGLLPLGPEFTLTADDQLVHTGFAHVSQTSFGGGSSHGGPQPAGPVSTLVGSSSGLQINLQWDSSVRTSANWSAVESAVVAAAQIYTGAFSNHAVLNIAVGLGEVGGSPLAAGALGESESNGYLAGYSTVASALGASDAALVQSGQMSAGATNALASLTGESFFITSAEAKALGLVSGQGTGVDGYIGLSGSSAVFFPAAGGAIKPTQYDAVGVAAHELSEVMGRIGMEGSKLGTHADVYTPLDSFRYTSPNTPAIHPGAGYFSTNFGVTNLNTYNNPSNGGDGADWASLAANKLDAYDAFSNPGVIDQVTAADLLEVAVLGYQVASGHILTTA